MRESGRAGTRVASDAAKHAGVWEYSAESVSAILLIAIGRPNGGGGLDLSRFQRPHMGGAGSATLEDQNTETGGEHGCGCAKAQMGNNTVLHFHLSKRI